MRDQGFSHLQDEERDDQLATQKLQRRSTQHVGENAIAESGIIESVTCYNFMCHERLHVELGPLINFIVGENGSGKSAVLTALTLCLGGKASDTNRGGSLRSFVKEGQDHGSLVVKIKNTGSDAYQPDIYGETIVVERHFSKTGSSGFKLKSIEGRVISNKKQEVDEISEWYALQISNPLTVLSQDNARQFLNSATPAQKYKYFVSGVQLEQLDNDYKMSQDTLDKTELLREDLVSKIERVKKEMDDAQRLAETAQKNHSLREKARHWRNQMIWSQVVEQERVLQARQEEVTRREQQISESEASVNERSNALDLCDQRIQRYQEAFEELKTDQGSLAERLEEAEAAFQSAKKELEKMHREERDAQATLRAITDEMERCKKQIADEEAKLSEESGTQRAEKDAERMEAMKKEEDIKSQMAAAAEELPRIRESLGEMKTALSTKRRHCETKKKDIVAAERHVQELKGGNRSKYDAYEPDMIRLLEAITEDNAFESNPIGPIGAYVRLKKPQWSGILEKTFGEALSAFVVKSKADQTRLSKMISRFSFKKQPQIYISKTETINTQAHEPASEFDTILRVLEFDDDVVRSQLIINGSIEKIILIEDRQEAQRVMTEGSRPPNNVIACLCFHDGATKIGQGLRLTNRNGIAALAPIHVPSVARSRMQTDSARQLDHAQKQLDQLGVQLLEAMKEEREAKQALQKLETRLTSQGKEKSQMEKELRNVQAKIEQAQMDLDSFEGVDDRLNSLRERLKEKQDEEIRVGNQYGNLRLAKREFNTSTEAANKKFKEVKAERQEFDARLNKALAKVETGKTARRIAVAEKNDAYESLDIAKNERGRAIAKQEEQAASVEEFIASARQHAPERVHIPDEETYDSIEKKYEKLRDQLLLREKKLGASDEEIYDRSVAAKARYDDVQKQTRDVDETIESLKAAIGHRLHLWRQFQRQISARIRIQFHYLLSERGFRGKIDLNHKARKINIQIEPDETRRSSAGRNTKTLSGGEKSFSSICMLLSVWEAIGSPIRCLDEFDVFMDNVNRAISTNMLVCCPENIMLIMIQTNIIIGRCCSPICFATVHSNYPKCHRGKSKACEGCESNSVSVSLHSYWV